MREVAEETGIFGRVLLHLSSIDYWFSGTDRRVHKVVHHFLLEALSGELTVENDPDQEAERVEGVRIDQVSPRLADSQRTSHHRNGSRATLRGRPVTRALGVPPYSRTRHVRGCSRPICASFCHYRDTGATSDTAPRADIALTSDTGAAESSVPS